MHSRRRRRNEGLQQLWASRERADGVLVYRGKGGAQGGAVVVQSGQGSTGRRAKLR